MHTAGSLVTIVSGAAGSYMLYNIYNSIDDQYVAAGTTLVFGIPMVIVLGKLIRRYIIDDDGRNGRGDPPNRETFSEDIVIGTDRKGNRFRRTRRKRRRY